MVSSRTEIARRQRSERIIQGLQKLPFLLRMVLFGLICYPIGLHLRLCRYLFGCPDRECPSTPWFRFNANKWPYYERAYMEILQLMHLEAYVRMWNILIPDFHIKIRDCVIRSRQYFKSLMHTTPEVSRDLANLEIDRIPMELVELVN